jgi:hypothetical protein
LFLCIAIVIITIFDVVTDIRFFFFAFCLLSLGALFVGARRRRVTARTFACFACFAYTAYYYQDSPCMSPVPPLISFSNSF